MPTTFAEDFYNELPTVNSEDSMLELMDRIMNESMLHEIKGDIGFFLFSDRSWLKTEMHGHALSSWHGILKDKFQLH